MQSHAMLVDIVCNTVMVLLLADATTETLLSLHGHIVQGWTRMELQEK
jgi:hypothetical protein